MKIKKIWVCAGLFLALCGCSRGNEAVFTQDFGGSAGAISGTAEPDAMSGDGTAASDAMSGDGTAGPDAMSGENSTALSAMSGDSTAGPDAGSEATQETEERTIVVDICGAVLHPGVYELREGDRVRDAVQKAGGLTAEADRNVLNQAAVLHDADKILVYTAQEVQQMREGGQLPENGQMQFTGQAQPAGQAQQGGADAKVNINLADVSELCSLSGIGEARARDIIAYREANGGFASVEDIMNVSGIKDATFNRIKEEITVQ